MTIAKSLSQGCNIGEALIGETESNAYEKKISLKHSTEYYF